MPLRYYRDLPAEIARLEGYLDALKQPPDAEPWKVQQAAEIALADLRSVQSCARCYGSGSVLGTTGANPIPTYYPCWDCKGTGLDERVGFVKVIPETKTCARCGKLVEPEGCGCGMWVLREGAVMVDLEVFRKYVYEEK